MNKHVTSPREGKIAVTLQSDTNDWSRSWTETPKTFYVTVTQDNIPLGNQKIKVEIDPADANKGIEFTQINDSALTDNETGNVKCYCTIKAPENVNSFTVFAIIDDGSASSDPIVSPVFPVSLEENSSAQQIPSIPAALDGVIDDQELAGGILVNMPVAGFTVGDTLYLLWGDTVLTHSIDDSDNDIYSHVLTLEDNPGCFENMRYDVRFFIADSAKNGHFSAPVSVLVRRKNGGDSHAWLKPVELTQGSDGIINQAEVENGITGTVKSDDIVDPNNPDNIIEKPLTKASSGQVELTGYNKSNHTVNTLTIDLPVPLDADKNDNIPLKKEDFPKEFFQTIGEGFVQVKCYLNIDGITYTIPEARQKKYSVDVIPPGVFAKK